MSSYQDFRTKLASMADDKYREFSMQGVPCERPFLGVRIPEIRELVKEIPAADLDGFLNNPPVAVEEVIARGYAVARLPYDQMLKVFDSQIKLFDNWCSVDTFCVALRKTIKHREADFLERKVEKLLKSQNEFAMRTGIVCLLCFYVKPDYLHLIFDRTESLRNRDEYYVKMGLAWLIAECFIKFPVETWEYLEHSNLNTWTLNKAISKICDSKRIAPEVKTTLRSLRR